MWIIIPWLIFAGIVAILADSRGRSGFGWFILAVLISPLIGALLVLVLPNLKVELRERELDRANSQKCPFCAERIKAEARVCRYCGRDVDLNAAHASELSNSIATVIGDGDFEMNVVGESHHQDEIEKLAGGRTKTSAHVECVATLIPEPDNPHDPNAVLVEVNGAIVGYLSRDIAPLFNAALARTGCGSATCAAVIVGGWSRGKSDRGSFGVKLNAFLPFELRGPLDRFTPAPIPFRPGRRRSVALQASTLIVGIAAIVAIVVLAKTPVAPKPVEPAIATEATPLTIHPVAIRPATPGPLDPPPLSAPLPHPPARSTGPVPLPRPRP
jgi:hypothetical protein